MLIEVAPDKFPCLGPSELRRKKWKFCRVVVWGKCGFWKRMFYFMEMCPYSGVRNFFGGVGPNYEWLIVEFVTLNLFVGNSFGTPAILCIWWFWHWEG